MILSRVHFFILGAALFAAGILISVSPAHATMTPDYPHLGLYDQVRSSGYPVMTTAGALDTATISQYAKYQLITLDATPFTDLRPDALAAIRARNPNIKLWAYVFPHHMWQNSGYDTQTYYQHYYAWANGDAGATAGVNNNWLYLANGTRLDSWLITVNLAKRTDTGDGTYTYTAANELADILLSDIGNKKDSTGRRLWDGMIFDGTAVDVTMLANTYAFDYARAGYPDKASFIIGWKAGIQALFTRIRNGIDDETFVLSANGGQGTSSLYPIMNGWMRENFPLQNGGSWQTNMFSDSVGYFFDQTRYRSPQYNFLFSWANSSKQNDPVNIKKERFGLGSASLGNGFSMFGNSTRETDISTGGYRFDTWWYDEYAVDRASAKASTNRQHTGWLGQPTSPVYQMISTNTNTSLVANMDLETDMSGWSAGSNGYGAITRDATVAHAGKASIKASVTTADAAWWRISPTTTLRTGLTGGRPYAVTFWAKASANRRINVSLAQPAGDSYADQIISVTTSWKQYQVALTPTQSASIVNLRFDTAETGGDVWFDDVRVQDGATNIYRRDFDYGTVLVNASAATQTVRLEKPFRKIAGNVDSVVNNGSLVTSVTIGPQDALFLLKTDPVLITDLTTANGKYSLTVKGKKVTIQPFGPTYKKTLWAKRVQFTAPLTTRYLFAPTQGYAKGAVKMYNEEGTLLVTLRPHDRYAISALSPSIIYHASAKSVYLALASQDHSGMVSLYSVQRTGATWVGNIAAASQGKTATIITRFLPLYGKEYGLVTAIAGQKTSLRVWRFSAKTKKFIRDIQYATKKIRLDGNRISL